MKHILPTINTVLPAISVVAFTIVFLALCIWVYSPHRRKQSEEYARLPLDEK